MIENPQEAGPDPLAPGQEWTAAGTDEARPWGFWATIGLSLIIGAGYTLVQVALVAVAVMQAVGQTESLDVQEFGRSLATNGFFWSVSVCAGAPIAIGLTLLFASMAKGTTVRDYLALHWRGWGAVVKWCLAILLFIVLVDAVTYIVRGRLVPPLLETVYQTAYSVPLLWFAFMIVAPVTEEIVFRGFLFPGFASSRLGPAGAIVLISLAWSFLHTQYDLYGVATVFLGGLLLGYARWRSRSLYAPLAMHVLQNLVATFEVMIYTRSS